MGLFGVDEVIQLRLAQVVITSDFHYVLVVFGHLFRVQVDQCPAHPFGMVNVVTEDNGFSHGVGAFQVAGDGLCHQLGALVDHQSAVKVLLVVDTVFDYFTVFVRLALGGSPALQVNIQIDTDHFVGGKEAVFNAFFQGVGVDRVAKVIGIGDFVSLFGSGGEANLSSAVEVFENLPPGTVFSGAAPVAFVDHDQVKEVRVDLFVGFLVFFLAGECLVQCQVDFVGGVYLATGDFGHGRAERLEVVDASLVHQHIAIRQEQNALLAFGLPQSPDNLEGGVGFAGARCHHQQYPILTC